MNLKYNLQIKKNKPKKAELIEYNMEIKHQKIYTNQKIEKIK